MSMTSGKMQFRLWLGILFSLFIGILEATGCVESPSAYADGPHIACVATEPVSAPLVITGSIPSELVRDSFWKRAKGYQAHIVVITTASQLAHEDLGSRLNLPHRQVPTQYPWAIRGSQQTTVLPLHEKPKVDDVKPSEGAFADATGIWVDSLPAEMSPEFVRALQTSLEYCRNELHVPIGGNFLFLNQIGLHDWLPAARFVESRQKYVSPDAFQVEMKAGDALIVDRREWMNPGDRPVEFYFPKTDAVEEETFSLQPHERHDGAALARAVHFRWPTIGSKRPRQKIESSCEKGSLIIVGGGGTPKGMIEKFIELAGGEDAPIVVLPTALEEPLPARDKLFEVRMLEQAGAKNVTLLPMRKYDDVVGVEFYDALTKAKGIWFSGGRQWRFVDAYAGTGAIGLFHDVLKRGGVIGGSSAGASIQGDFMCRGNPLGNLQIDSFGYQQGFAFLTGSAIDQHFSQRKRLPELMKLIRQRPQFLGIGLDEGTAILVQGTKAEVFGKGQAFFIDGSLHNDEPPTVHSLEAKEVFDLARRMPIETEKPAADERDKADE